MFPALVRQGPHAFGWMSYAEEEEVVHIEKYTGRCDTDEAWKTIMKRVDPDPEWLVGHTRWATHGDPEDQRNNHPIPHGNIVGVHNGVLENHEEILSVTGRQDPETVVDSEAIFAAVNKWGHTKGLRRVKGSMVAVYTDLRRPEVLKIARTQGRELHIGWTGRGNLIFASDRDALLRLQPEINFRKFSFVSTNRILTIRYGQIIDRRFFIQPPKPSVPDGWFELVRESQESVWRNNGTGVPVPSGITAAQVRADAQRRLAERRARKLFPNGIPEKKNSLTKQNDSATVSVDTTNEGSTT